MDILKNSVDKDKEKDDNIHAFNILFINETRTLKSELKKRLKGFKCKYKGKETQLFTFLFQQIGNNIRSSGDPYNSEFSHDNFFLLAARANELIKKSAKIVNPRL